MLHGNEIEDSLRLLVSPEYALVQVSVIVFFFASLIFGIGKAGSRLFWRGTAVAAELLSVVGLIGLSVMAGRMLLDQDLQSLRNSEMQAGMALQEYETRILAGLCIPMDRDLRPTIAVAKVAELCAVVRDRKGGIFGTDIDWQRRRESFLALSLRGAPGDGFAPEAGKMVKLIDAYVSVKSKIPLADLNNSVLPRLTSPWLVLICLCLAITGLALKIARTVWEFKEEAKARKKSSP